MPDLPPVYLIRTVGDFLQVPEDRLDECLRSFAASINGARRAKAAILAMAPNISLPEDAIILTNFRWLDDGERTTRMEFEKKGEVDAIADTGPIADLVREAPIDTPESRREQYVFGFASECEGMCGV